MVSADYRSMAQDMDILGPLNIDIEVTSRQLKKVSSCFIEGTKFTSYRKAYNSWGKKFVEVKFIYNGDDRVTFLPCLWKHIDVKTA